MLLRTDADKSGASSSYPESRRKKTTMAMEIAQLFVGSSMRLRLVSQHSPIVIPPRFESYVAGD